MGSWTITLSASSAPPPLMPLPRPELAHLDVFVSRTTEDGRDRYRLHLGDFTDAPSATRALGIAREYYPAAWLVPAGRYRPLLRLKGTAVATPSAAAADDPGLESAEIFALLEGAADLLTRVLPEYPMADSMKDDREAVDDRPGDREAVVQVRKAVSPESPLNVISRFIIEEWQPEARRTVAPRSARPWYSRLRRVKRQA